MSWQNKFDTYVQGTAFNLSLSRNHISLLFAIEADTYLGWTGKGGRSSFIPTFHALERRGLAEYNPAAKLVGFRHPHVKLKWVYRLTPAGQKVAELLRLTSIDIRTEEKADA